MNKPKKEHNTAQLSYRWPTASNDPNFSRAFQKMKLREAYRFYATWFPIWQHVPWPVVYPTMEPIAVLASWHISRFWFSPRLSLDPWYSFQTLGFRSIRVVPFLIWVGSKWRWSSRLGAHMSAVPFMRSLRHATFASIIEMLQNMPLDILSINQLIF